MQNSDKGLLELDGKTLIDHVVSKLAPQVSNLIINANRHLDEYAKFGFPVYPDINDSSAIEHGYRGPLAGIEVGLIHCQTPYLVTVPCDSPFLPTDLVKRLMDAFKQQQADIAIACTGDPTQPRDQPVFCLIKAELLTQIQHYLRHGGRKMDGWYGQLSVARVYFEDETAFRNINTLEELRACSAVKK